MILIGKVIQQYRKYRNLSQGELANRCGVARETICRIELDKFSPNLNLLNRIASVLGVRGSEMLLMSEETTYFAMQLYSCSRCKAKFGIDAELGKDTLLECPVCNCNDLLIETNVKIMALVNSQTEQTEQTERSEQDGATPGKDRPYRYLKNQSQY